MDPHEITDIDEWNPEGNSSNVAPSYVNNYKLTGVTTNIPNSALNVRSTLQNKGAFINFFNSIRKKESACVCVKEIKLDWYPHGELNHVSFMEVKIFNTFKKTAKTSKTSDFFMGRMPIHVHWSISVSSPRWITVENYMCNSPWSYAIIAKDMPQEELQNAGSLRVSYTVEKGRRDSESQYEAPRVTLDTAPFPYMVPFYRFSSPGGLIECNISNIRKVLDYMERSLISCGINDKISKPTIWGISNTMNADMQNKLVSYMQEDKSRARNLIEQIIQGVINQKSPGYPSFESIIKLSDGAIDNIISNEIVGIGDDIGSISRRY